MKKAIIFLPKTALQFSLLLALFFYSLGASTVQPVYAGSSDATSCGTLLADAQAKFVATLSANGAVPASPETKAAADEYIRVSKLCYDELAAQNSLSVSPTDTSTFIDNDGILLGDQSSAEFVLTGGKWGSSTMGTPGGTVTYSFMGSGLDLSTEPNSSGFGKSVAVTDLPNFKVCFITEIQNAFAAWQAVSNIQFVQVNDSNTAFGAPDAAGDIRIGAHAFDGPSGTLAHAYFPSSNGGSGTGDMHFDKAETWTCDNSGVNIGVVALHEIGHALGLNHENTSALAVMDPYYNPNLGGLQTDDINGITTIYGAAALTGTAPDNDNFADANTRPVSPIPYLDTEDTTGATVESTDPKVPVACDGHSLNKGAHTVWYLYQPGASTRISMDTIGSDYDTYIAVWTGSQPNLTFVACDDDRSADLQSQVVFNAQGGKTYYVEVAGYTGTNTSYPQPNPGGNLVFHANLTNVDVTVGTSLIDSYFVPASHEARRSYALNNGPMKVVNTTTDPTLSSIRVLFTGTSYSEMMGLPTGQVSQEYWFPSYNNVNLNSQLRVGNLGNTSTIIKVYLGATQIDSYTLGAGAATRKNYTDINKVGLNGGPLRVTSSATKILSTIRLLYNNQSFSELMGLPKEQLTTSYLFPYYNNVAMTSNLQVSNVGTVATTIRVYLGSSTTPIDTFSLAAKKTLSRIYTGKNSGPLKVTSSAANIVPSIRVLFSNQSYSEMIGYPGNKLTTEFWYPVYDNASLNSQVRVSNVGTASTIITVYFGTKQIDSYPLGAGLASRKNYKDVNNVPLNGGPLHVVSSSQPILSTVRELYQTSTFQSFYELMGLPGTQLSAQYYFPWYNNSAMDSELRLAMP